MAVHLVYALNYAPAILRHYGVVVRRRYGRLASRRWQRNSWLAVGTLALMASAKTGVAEQNSEALLQRLGNGNPVAGKHKSAAERCQECHGTEGQSDDARIPNHAGQYADYLIKQLNNFQSGARRYDIMNKMAADLSSEDIADIAAYFAGQKPMHGDGKAGNSQIADLFANGDPARNIPACVSCHGENGKGRLANNVIYPLIAGQRKLYLRRQLIYWKLSERTNSPDGVMNQVVQALTDDEIDNLSDYISGL